MPDDAAYLDAALPIADRARDLLARMTLEEKLGQLGSAWAFEILVGTAFDPDRARHKLGDGIGQITRVAGATNLERREVAELANRIQRYLVEETRLGIPAIVHEESLHGFLARGVVCFPQSIGLAATWEPALIGDMARSIGRAMRAAGAHQALAPIFDVTRDPRWGRLEETYGEDPYLIAELGAAYVRGIQNDGRIGEGGVIATGKHMVGHGLPEGGLNHAPAHIGERELRDVFLFPFEAAVRGAGLRSIMHAYDDVDGVPCVESRELLSATLRERWGFDGIVVSDYAGIDELISSHRVVGNLAEAGARTLEAGVDVELPTTSAYGAPLAEAIASGRIDIAYVDRAVERGLLMKFELGLFEHPYVDAALSAPPLDDDRALAAELARRSIVLLQNDGTLPLRRDQGSIAVIGPNADSARNLLGDYSHIAHIETLIEMRDTNNAWGFPIPADLNVAEELAGRPTILDAIRAAVSPATEVRHAQGCGILDGTDADIAEAVEAARASELAILVVGERSGLVDGCTSGEARDRLDIGLPGRQSELVAAVGATGTPIVLVLVGGRPLAVVDEAAVAAAIIHAWVPGDEGPGAIVDVLFGAVNPGGKLPITVPRHSGQIPLYYAHKPSGGRSHWKETYVDGSNLPLWPFGHGLSYTTFALHGPELDRQAIDRDGQLQVTVEVENTGPRSGDEVVQLYVRDMEASVTRPVKELRGFRRVSLAPAARRRVTFTLAAEQLAFTGVDGRLRLEPGRFELLLGTSSAELPCRAEFELTGEVVDVESRSRYFTASAVD